MRILKILKNAKAICWINNNCLLYYKKSGFYFYYPKEDKNKFFCKMNLTKKLSLLSKNHLLRRLFRLYPQSPIFVKERKTLYFSFYGCVYSLDIESKSLIMELNLNHGASRVLSFCSYENGDVYFGEYPTHNNDDDPICIYRKTNDKWSVVYEFSQKEIRHIHYLLINKKDLLCFTGDEDYETKILLFKNMDFENPVCLASNDQSFRSCLATFADEKSFIYFTDTPYLENKIFDYNLLKSSRTELKPLDGTVIYGLRDGDIIYFSTCVEHNLKKDKNNKNVRIKIDGVNGGIKSKYSQLYSYNLKDGLLVNHLALKKDCFPIKFFGIGTFVFTSNYCDDYLAVTSSSIGTDESLIILMKE